MSVKRAVYARLERMGIPFRAVDHAPVFTLEECKLPEALLGGLMPKNLFLAPRNLSSYWLLIARADSAFRTSSISRQAGVSRLAFAPEAELCRLFRTRPGAVSPMGLMFDEHDEAHVLIDRKLLDEEILLFHPCVNDATLAMSARDFLGVFLPGVGKTPAWADMDSE